MIFLFDGKLKVTDFFLSINNDELYFARKEVLSPKGPIYYCSFVLDVSSLLAQGKGSVHSMTKFI